MAVDCTLSHQQLEITPIFICHSHIPSFMRLEFLGGAGEVGRLAMLLYDGNTKYLFDYGFNPSKPPEYPMRAPRVDYAFISHSHVDHSGMVPVMSAWEDTGIYATSPTISTASLLMEDSVKVGEAEGHPPPYNRSDIKNVCRRLSCVSFGETRRYGDIEVTPHSAGHIPGAAMFELNGRETTLFTGDINNPNYSWQDILTEEQKNAIKDHLSGCTECTDRLSEEMLADAWFSDFMNQLRAARAKT